MGLAALALSWTFCAAATIGLVRIENNVALIRNTAALDAARAAALLALVDQETGVRGFVATRNPMFLDIYVQGRARLANARRDAVAARDRDDVLRRLDLERAQAAQRVERFFENEIDLMRAGQDSAAVSRLRAGKIAFDNFRLVDGRLHARLAARHIAAQAAFNHKLNWAQRGIWIMLGFSLLLAGYLTVLIRASALIEHQATRDPLTGLANRRSFDAHIRRLAADAAQAGDKVGLIVLDLDGFKPINDTYGHDCGDTLLRIVASRLVAAVRHTDVVARLGGDEFAVGFRARRGAAPDALVACIRAVFATPFVLAAQTTVAASCSLGVSLSTDETSVDALLAAADGRMYVEKRCKQTDERSAPTVHTRL